MPAVIRRFTLFNAMVLVAATAAGLAMTRLVAGFPQFNRTFSSFPPTGVDEDVLYWIHHLAFWPVPVLTTWTLALLILSLPRHRPTLRRLARHPGTAAGLALLLSLIMITLYDAKDFTMRLTTGRDMKGLWHNWWIWHWIELGHRTGFIVIVAWLTLALSGRWSARADWHDRLGRISGVCWILLGLIWFADDLLASIVRL